MFGHLIFLRIEEISLLFLSKNNLILTKINFNENLNGPLEYFLKWSLEKQERFEVMKVQMFLFMCESEWLSGRLSALATEKWKVIRLVEEKIPRDK